MSFVLCPSASANTSAAIIDPVIRSAGDAPLAVKVYLVDANGTATGTVAAPLPVTGTTTAGASTSTTSATLSQGVKAVASAGTPVLLVAAQTLVESVEIHARKNTTTANTGAIYVGFSSTAGQNYRVLLAGEVWSVTAPAGKKIDLHTIYIDAATSADAVTWTASN